MLNFGALGHNLKAVVTLGPAGDDRHRADRGLHSAAAVADAAASTLPGSGPLLVFFVAIGLGFMLIETSQMQRLIITLGHPTYGLSVVLFALLLSSGSAAT